MEFDITVDTKPQVPAHKKEHIVMEIKYRETPEPTPITLDVKTHTPELQIKISEVETTVPGAKATDVTKDKEPKPPTAELQEISAESKEPEKIPPIEITSSKQPSNLKIAAAQPFHDEAPPKLPEAEPSIPIPAPVEKKIRRRSSVLPPTSSLVPWYKSQSQIGEITEKPVALESQSVISQLEAPQVSRPAGIGRVKESHSETAPVLQSFAEAAPLIPSREETTPHIESFAPAATVADDQGQKRKYSETKMVPQEDFVVEKKVSQLEPRPPPSLSMIIRRRSSIMPPTAAVVPGYRRKSSGTQGTKTSEAPPPSSYEETTPGMDRLAPASVGTEGYRRRSSAKKGSEKELSETTPALVSFPQEAPPIPSYDETTPYIEPFVPAAIATDDGQERKPSETKMVREEGAVDEKEAFQLEATPRKADTIKLRRRSSVMPPTAAVVPGYRRKSSAIEGTEKQLPYTEATPPLESFPQEAPPIPSKVETTPCIDSFAPAAIVADDQGQKRKTSEAKTVRQEGAVGEEEVFQFEASPRQADTIKIRRRSSVMPPTAAVVPGYRRKSSGTQETKTYGKEPTYVETTPVLEFYPQEAPPVKVEPPLPIPTPAPVAKKIRRRFFCGATNSRSCPLEQKSVSTSSGHREACAVESRRESSVKDVKQAAQASGTTGPKALDQQETAPMASSEEMAPCFEGLPPASVAAGGKALGAPVPLTESRELELRHRPSVREDAEGRVVPAFRTGESVGGPLVAVSTTPKKKRSVADLEEQPSSAETQSSQEEEEPGTSVRKDKSALTLYDEKAPNVVLAAKKQEGRFPPDVAHAKPGSINPEVKESQPFVPRPDETSSLVEIALPRAPKQASSTVRAEQPFSRGEFLPATQKSIGGEKAAEEFKPADAISAISEPENSTEGVFHLPAEDKSWVSREGAEAGESEKERPKFISGSKPAEAASGPPEQGVCVTVLSPKHDEPFRVLAGMPVITEPTKLTPHTGAIERTHHISAPWASRSSTAAAEEATRGRAAWEKELTRATALDRRIERLHEKKTAKYSVVIKDGQPIRSISSSSDCTEPVKEDFSDLAYQYVASEEQVLERIVTVDGTMSTNAAPYPPSGKHPPGKGTKGGGASGAHTASSEPEPPKSEQTEQPPTEGPASESQFKSEEATPSTQQSSSFELGIPVEEQREFPITKDHQTDEMTTDTGFEEFASVHHEDRGREAESSALESSTALESGEQLPALEYPSARVDTHSATDKPFRGSTSSRVMDDGAKPESMKAVPKTKSSEKHDTMIKASQVWGHEQTHLLTIAPKTIVPTTEHQELELSSKLPQLEYFPSQTAAAEEKPKTKSELTVPALLPQQKIEDKTQSGEIDRQPKMAGATVARKAELQSAPDELVRIKPTCPAQPVIAVEEETPALDAFPESFLQPTVHVSALEKPPTKLPIDIYRTAKEHEALTTPDKLSTQEEKPTSLKAVEHRPPVEYHAPLHLRGTESKEVPQALTRSQEMKIYHQRELPVSKVVPTASKALLPVTAPAMIEAPSIPAATAQAEKQQDTAVPFFDKTGGVDTSQSQQAAIVKNLPSEALDAQVRLSAPKEPELADKKLSTVPILEAAITRPVEKGAVVTSDATASKEYARQTTATVTSTMLVPWTESAPDELRTAQGTDRMATESERASVEATIGKRSIPPDTAVAGSVQVMEATDGEYANRAASFLATLPTEIAQQIPHEAPDATVRPAAALAIPGVTPLLEPYGAKHAAGAEQQRTQAEVSPSSLAEQAAVGETEHKFLEPLCTRLAIEHRTSEAGTEQMKHAASRVTAVEDELTRRHVPENNVQALAKSEVPGTSVDATQKESESVVPISEPQVTEMPLTLADTAPAAGIVEPVTRDIKLEEVQYLKTERALQQKPPTDLKSDVDEHHEYHEEVREKRSTSIASLLRESPATIMAHLSVASSKPESPGEIDGAAVLEPMFKTLRSEEELQQLLMGGTNTDLSTVPEEVTKSFTDTTEATITGHIPASRQASVPDLEMPQKKEQEAASSEVSDGNAATDKPLAVALADKPPGIEHVAKQAVQPSLQGFAPSTVPSSHLETALPKEPPTHEHAEEAAERQTEPVVLERHGKLMKAPASEAAPEKPIPTQLPEKPPAYLHVEEATAKPAAVKTPSLIETDTREAQVPAEVLESRRKFISTAIKAPVGKLSKRKATLPASEAHPAFAPELSQEEPVPSATPEGTGSLATAEKVTPHAQTIGLKPGLKLTKEPGSALAKKEQVVHFPTPGPTSDVASLKIAEPALRSAGNVGEEKIREAAAVAEREPEKVDEEEAAPATVSAPAIQVADSVSAVTGGVPLPRPLGQLVAVIPGGTDGMRADAPGITESELAIADALRVSEQEARSRDQHQQAHVQGIIVEAPRHQLKQHEAETIAIENVARPPLLEREIDQAQISSAALPPSEITPYAEFQKSLKASPSTTLPSAATVASKRLTPDYAVTAPVAVSPKAHAEIGKDATEMEPALQQPLVEKSKNEIRELAAAAVVVAAASAAVNAEQQRELAVLREASIAGSLISAASEASCDVSQKIAGDLDMLPSASRTALVAVLAAEPLVEPDIPNAICGPPSVISSSASGESVDRLRPDSSRDRSEELRVPELLAPALDDEISLPRPTSFNVPVINIQYNFHFPPPSDAPGSSGRQTQPNPERAMAAQVLRGALAQQGMAGHIPGHHVLTPEQAAVRQITDRLNDVAQHGTEPYTGRQSPGRGTIFHRLPRKPVPPVPRLQPPGGDMAAQERKRLSGFRFIVCLIAFLMVVFILLYCLGLIGNRRYFMYYALSDVKRPRLLDGEPSVIKISSEVSKRRHHTPRCNPDERVCYEAAAQKTRSQIITTPGPVKNHHAGNNEVLT
ncbi:hypothetical protein HPB52_006609 [Rhipicephalus sanguineus]|uniref:Uncharacterized protein n=1 Tax=Rhipicephalus sanguineus TaxID=34632 RepID=A0A9D4QDN9_RHISA|nr:hypothetical protein HPB52_006609 [Rhipicephalus sanguineus]